MLLPELVAADRGPGLEADRRPELRLGHLPDLSLPLEETGEGLDAEPAHRVASRIARPTRTAQMTPFRWEATKEAMSEMDRGSTAYSPS